MNTSFLETKVTHARRHGFTLLELVVVIAILSILSSIIILVLNPAQRIAKAYDAQRLSDINTLQKAVQQYYIDNRNYSDLHLSQTPTEICDTRWLSFTDSNDCRNLVDLSKLVPEFIVAVPTEPLYLVTKPTRNEDILFDGNGYTISIDTTNQVQVQSLLLTTNNSQLPITATIRIVDVRLQVIVLALIVTICVALALFFVIQRNKRE